MGGFAPQQVRIGCIGKTAGNGLLNSGPRYVEAFHGTFPGNEGRIVLIHIGSDQTRCICVCTCEQNRRHIHDVCRQARGDQFLHRFLGRHQHLAAHVAAFLG